MLVQLAFLNQSSKFNCQGATLVPVNIETFAQFPTPSRNKILAMPLPLIALFCKIRTPTAMQLSTHNCFNIFLRHGNMYFPNWHYWVEACSINRFLTCLGLGFQSDPEVLFALLLQVLPLFLYFSNSSFAHWMTGIVGICYGLPCPFFALICQRVAQFAHQNGFSLTNFTDDF